MPYWSGISYHAFFFASFKQIIANYPRLFDSESEQGDSGSGSDGNAGGAREQIAGYYKHWNWYIWFEAISNLSKEKWTDIEEWEVYRFLNMMAFIKDKKRYENDMLKLMHGR